MTRASRIALIALSSSGALLIAACSSSGAVGTNPTASSGPPGRPPAGTQASTATSTPTPGAASSASTAGKLAGSWKGRYSGAYSGTFTLTWQQSGAKLAGRIHISNPDATLAINGTVHGEAISFGTVGSLAVTYSGSVHGNSMSGSYQVGGATGGPWNADKA